MLTNEQLREAVSFLLENAEDAARSSRDFGRGYMYAVRLLEKQMT